jgi:hypothetical protein
MKLKTLAATLAGVFAAGGPGLLAAHPAAEYNPATDRDLFISGASAPELALLEYMSDEFCAAGSLDIYIAANQFIYYCTPNASLGLGSARVALRKSSVGGSGNGTGPACARATTIPFLNFSAIGTVTSAFPTATISGSTRTAFSVPATFTTTGAAVQVDGGFSDLEPSLFPDLPGITACFTPPPSTSVVSNPVFGIIFGVPVTKAFRDALQTAQGLTPGSETVQDMPSLTLQQLRSIYRGALSNTSAIPGGGLPAQQIFIARRVGTSGTQRSFAAYFLNQRCIPGVVAFAGNDVLPAQADSLCASTSPPTVYHGSGSQNVVNCLNNHNAAGRYAVGVLSTEFVPNTSTGTGGAGYRFIKIGGAVPSLLQTLESRHELWYEATCQYRSDARNTDVLQKICGGPGASPAPGIGSASVIQKLIVQQHFTDGGVKQFAGVMGLYAPPGSVPPAPPMTNASVGLNPVQSAIRSVAGGPNSCQPPILQVPTSNKNTAGGMIY